MGRSLQRFNQTIQEEHNIENRKKTPEVRLRRPLNDKTNLLKTSHITPYNGKDKVIDARENCESTNKHVTRFNLKKKWKINDLDAQTGSADVKNLSPFVLIPNISIDEIIKRSNFNSSHICLQRLSSATASKYLKECCVINLPEETCTVNEKYKMETKEENKRFSLRKLKRIDYAKIHRGSSLLNEDVKQTSTEHIPVYKHKIDEGKDKRKDVYEFDSDSEKQKKRRKKSSMNSRIYDKEMKTVMHKIEEKEQKQLRRRRKINIKTNQKKLQSVREATTKNINVNDGRRKKDTRGDENNLEHKQALNLIQGKLHTKPDGPVHVGVHDNGSDLSDFDTAPLELEICTNNRSTSINIANKVPANRINIFQNIDLTKYARNEMNRENEKTKSIGAKDTNLHQKTDEKDPFDALLTEDNTESFEMDTLDSPQAKSTPWRSDLQVRRNPLFLQYKETSLPSYNQDLVIDSVTTEKFLIGNKTPKNNTSSNTKQASILSYVNGKSVVDSPDVIESSLYDIHEFSPIKSVRNSTKKSLKRSPDKENLFLRIEDTPLKGKLVDKTKRQILGERVNNSENIANNSPAKTLRNNQNSNDEMQVTYFGFDSSSNRDNGDNGLQKSKKCVWLFGKPMRLEDYLMVANTSEDKVVNMNFAKNKDSASLDNEYLEKDKDEEDSNAIGEEILSSSLKLFEDLEPIRNDAPKKYERARKRRVRKHSIDLEEDDENEQIHSRKKKHNKKAKNQVFYCLKLFTL
ncbi:hypothetical protein AMK59_6369 [Oryctes borbonicus]|uniref:Uncharacterized protein n=1 Tax=Oryctes borbonicus TaxID=1629725 RepID=A0A0T6ASG1_9SCAR|nr:hypothetical protein AMK59_6369 [Oryctes borbonicus]